MHGHCDRNVFAPRTNRSRARTPVCSSLSLQHSLEIALLQSFFSPATTATKDATNAESLIVPSRAAKSGQPP